MIKILKFRAYILVNLRFKIPKFFFFFILFYFITFLIYKFYTSPCRGNVFSCVASTFLKLNCFESFASNKFHARSTIARHFKIGESKTFYDIANLKTMFVRSKLEIKHK